MGSDRSSRPVDLHTHSTASDGAMRPLDLVREALALGLGALAITDHDTLAGVREVLDAGFAFDLDFLPGVEISACPPEGFGIAESLHILGYGMDPSATGLSLLLEKLQLARETRNPRMVEKLRALGCDISFEEVLVAADGGLVGRPHMARVLVDKGVVRDMDTAFSRFLGRGRPAYVKKEQAGWEEAIAAIRRAGGIAVLAHPGLIGEVDASGLFSLLKILVEAGLGGLEVYYPRHSSRLTGELEGFCRRLGLLPTGGSDFHGSLKDGVSLGSGDGNLSVPYRVYADLAAALERL